MKKCNLVTFAVTAFIVIIVPVLAGSDEVCLRYRWLPSKLYMYRYTYKAECDGNGSNIFQDDLLITVLDTNQLVTTLALQGFGVNNFIQFVHVDQFGRSTRKAYFTKLENYFTDSNNKQMFEEASKALTLYNQLIWEVPSQPIHSNTNNIGPHGSVWYCAMQTDLCVMEKVYEAEPKKDQSSKRLFDTENGKLVEFIEIYGREFNGLVLKGITSVSEQDLILLREQYGKSIDIDEFLERVFKPYANTSDPMIKRTVYYSRLAKIQDEDRLHRIWKEFIQIPEDNSDFRQFVKPIILKNISQCKRWAIELVIKEDLLKLGHDDFERDSRRILSKISGLDQATMEKSWKDWFGRIEKVVPDFGNTLSEILVYKTTHRDPWVRLFVLKELARREGIAAIPRRYRKRLSEWTKVELLPVFEKASSDQDEAVRSFGLAALKILRKDAEHAIGRNSELRDRPSIGKSKGQ
jgi:hypothetical protein